MYVNITDGKRMLVADIAARYSMNRLMLVETVALQHFPCVSASIWSGAPVAR